MGGSSDHRYDQSFIVRQSAEAGMPIVAVSINYRLSAWGLLYGKEVKDSGNATAGFRDQRLVLAGVRENITAFGGDPDRVTIQGRVLEVLPSLLGCWPTAVVMTSSLLVLLQRLATLHSIPDR